MDKSRIFPLLFLTICNTALGCNLDWFLHQGKCYKYFTTTADFRMARKYCQVFKADLGYVYQYADFLMNFASETRFWVREDSYIETAVTETPGCPYLLNRKVDNTDCNNMLGFICESPYESTASHCPSDWLLYDSKCYKIVEQQKNYTESLTACSSEGGQLAVLDDETKEKNAQAVIIGNDNLFLVDATFDNETFKWSSGKPFTPACSVCTNFTLNGNCLGMKSSSSHPTMFQWDNVDCNANNSFLCVMAAIENITTTTLPPTKATPRKLCPIGYNWKAYPDSSNYCFWETTYETERLNWYQARQFCQGYGGDLATYSSSNEEDHGLGGAKGHYKGLWFGLRRGEDDVLRWVDGMNLNYTNWKYGEPNLRSNKYCASHALGSARWELDYCGVRRWFICKAPKVEVPTLPDIKFEKPMCNFTTSSAYRSSWYLYNNHCYLVHNEAKYTWDLAQNFCQDNGAHLASVHSFNETDFILFAGSIVANSEYWIGLSAKGLGSSFTWSDGTPFDFLYWKDDSVINQTARVNSCVTFDQQRGFWTVTNCNLLLGVICKRGVNATYDFPTQEPTPVLPGNCEPGWYPLGNQCYKVFGKKWTQRQSWQNAQNRCENESASLASIHNKEQQNFLTDLILEVDEDAWIGLKYLVREIHWIDNTPLDYANWDSNEPSFTSDDDESDLFYIPHSQGSCVKLVYGRRNMGKWNDVSCNQIKAFICQKQKDPSLTNPSEDPFSCSNKTGWSRLGTSCFRIFEEKTQKMSCTAAQSKCRTYEADLVIFKNSAVAVFLSKRITQKDEFFWIGVREMEKGKYVSLTQAHSKRLTQTNWLPGQPSRISATMDNCVAMNSEGKWMVRSCRENLAFVCEWNSEPEQEIVVDESRMCPKFQGWLDIGGDMCIKTYILQKSWNEAMRHCFQIGGALVTFHSPKDLKVFIDYVNSYFRYSSVHIGLARRRDGSYMWVDYSPVDFEAWDPDDVPNATKDCVELDLRSEKWRKVHCDDIRRDFFCSTSKLTESYEDLSSNSTRTDDMINQKLAIGGIFGIVICLIVVLTIISLTVYYLCPLRRMRGKLLVPDTQ